MPRSSSAQLLVSCALTLGALRLFSEVRFIAVYATLLGLAPLYLMDREGASGSADPYGSFHLRLNGARKGSPPKTEWLNMGYWKDTSSFPQACEALAMKLVAVSQMKAGAVVLDVGHGTGESIINLLTNPDVPRPSHVAGITSLLSHAQRTAERVEMITGASPPRDGSSGTPKVTIVHGDAIYNPKAHDPSSSFGGLHPFSPFFESQYFDTVFALDCAYHFRTRQRFLSQALDKLAPDGRIALADICFSQEAQESKITTLWGWLIGIPRDNMITVDKYEKMLLNMGYVDVVVEDITESVFPGFLAFLKTQGLGWVIAAVMMDKIALSGARYVVVGAKKGHTVQ